MHLSVGILLVSAHRVVYGVSRKTSCLTLIALLLLHPHDDEDLCNHDAPKNTPNRQNTFEGIYLEAYVSLMLLLFA